MKKFKSSAVAALLILSMAGSSAISTAASNAEHTDFSQTSIGIEPFSSAIVSGVNYSLTKTSATVTVSLVGVRSGNIRAVVQRLNNGTWVDHAVIADNNFPASVQVVRTKSHSLASGTYRIRVTVTSSGYTFTGNSSSYVV